MVFGLAAKFINDKTGRVLAEVSSARQCVIKNTDKVTDGALQSLASATDDLKEITTCATKNMNKVTDGALQSLASVTRDVDRIVTCGTGSLDKLTNGTLTSLGELTNRCQISIALMVNVVLGLAAAGALCPLLYLTQSSKLLYGIVWTMYSSLCFNMVLSYVEQSKFLKGKNSIVHRLYDH